MSQNEEAIYRCVVCGDNLPESSFLASPVFKGIMINACLPCMKKIVQPPVSYNVSRQERMARLTQQNEWFCNTCKQWKPVEAFYKNRTRAFGLEYSCKECFGKRAKKRYREEKISGRERLADSLVETKLLGQGVDTKNPL